MRCRETVANLGVFVVLQLYTETRQSPAAGDIGIVRNRGWIASAIILAAGYALILGPGVMVHF